MHHETCEDEIAAPLMQALAQDGLAGATVDGISELIVAVRAVEAPSLQEPFVLEDKCEAGEEHSFLVVGAKHS